MGGGTDQGRPLADWTDCFQSGPTPKGAPHYAYWPTQAYARPTVCLSVGSFANENQSELSGILTSSFIIIRSGIATVWPLISMCGLVFSTAASQGRVGLRFEAVFLLQLQVISRLLLFQQLLPLVFWRLILACNCKCVLLIRSVIALCILPHNLFIAPRIYNLPSQWPWHPEKGAF